MTTIRKTVEAGHFISYPTNCVVGVLDDEASLVQVQAALERDGLAESVVALEGEEGANEIDASGAHHGLLARLVRLIQFTTMDNNQSRRYEDEVREGRIVLIVHVDHREAALKARAILKEHGGHFINWYGRLQLEVLDD